MKKVFENIDEAIAIYKDITNTYANCPAHCNISCDMCVKESEQILEWLEELKELRATSFGYRKEAEQYNVLYSNNRKGNRNLQE